MLDRRTLVLAAAAASLMTALPAFAGDAQPYGQAAFDKAIAAGKPVVLHVTAPWCPTCKAQKPILSDLRSSKRFAELVQFDIDFDTQKDLLRKLGVQSQSTLIAYKGGKEIGRSVGDTNGASITGLVEKTL